MEFCDDYTGATAYKVKRKSADFLPMQNDILLAADILAGVLIGYTAFIIYGALIGVSVPSIYFGSALWRETLLGSVITALVLREPRLGEGRQFRRPEAVYIALCQRGSTALAILLVVGLATQALGDIAPLWILLWAVSFAVWLALSRALLARYATWVAERDRVPELVPAGSRGCGERSPARGVACKAVAVMGSAGLADRMVEILSEHAKVAAVYDDIDFMDDAELADTLNDISHLVEVGAVDTIVMVLSAGSEDLVETLDLFARPPYA